MGADVQVGMTSLKRCMQCSSSEETQRESFIARRVMGTGTAFRACGRQWTMIGRLPYLGRGILFGLEFLVAADIIHTVAVELTFTTVGGLAIIVLIRTFLSFTLEVELTGHWPWQNKSGS